MVYISPLALHYEYDPTTTQRFELYIGGMEIANCYLLIEQLGMLFTSRQ